MSAPTIRAYGTTNDGGLSVPINVPATDGPQVGDYMLAIINTVAASAVITPPSGGQWTQVLAPSALGSRYGVVFAAVRGANDPSRYAFTQNNTGAVAAVLVYGIGKVGTVKSAFVKGANLYTQTTPGVTTTVADSLVLSVQFEATSAPETGDPITVNSPFTKDLWYLQAGSNPVNSVLIAHRILSTPGASGDAVSNWPNQTGNRGSIMLTIEPAAAEVITKLPAVVSDGAGKPVKVGLTVWDGTKERGLAKLELLQSGSFVPDIDRMSRVFTMAHRGGSKDYQEHSKQAYVHASIAGVDVMEMSLVRSSDGYWYGAHDETADRTSSSVRGQNWKFSEHTAAEIDALTQDLPNRGDTRFSNEPYLRVTEFVAQWMRSHTLMFDLKYATTAQRMEFYTWIQTLSDYRQRILFKFYHTGTAIANESHAIGCKVWGYAYSEAITGIRSDGQPTREPLLKDTASFWDYLGQEYTATEAVWAETVRIAGGKKVIGHIVPDLKSAQDAVRYGARGLQVSGINSVAPYYRTSL